MTLQQMIQYILDGIKDGDLRQNIQAFVVRLEGEGYNL